MARTEDTGSPIDRSSNSGEMNGLGGKTRFQMVLWTFRLTFEAKPLVEGMLGAP